MASLFNDITGLFFPHVCAVCGGTMAERAERICTYCRSQIPLTGFWMADDNPVVNLFRPHFPVVRAFSYIYFVDRSGFRNLIHQFKYSGGWTLARTLGEWFGRELHDSGVCADVDLIVPVPLHIRKKLRRGYNQAEYIARGISASTGIATDTKSVARSIYNRSQTSRTRAERWENVEGIFSVRRPAKLEGRHILLVDDVLTTGATVISMAASILEAAPGCRISVATLAVSKSGLTHG